MKKSTRHSEITGDFAEALVLYWLSRDGFECARLDHTGIDLIARNRHTDELMGISVKSRSRFAGTERESVNLPPDGFVKAREACKSFGCVPYYAIVVDGADVIRCFLLSLAHLEEIVGVGEDMHYWRMSNRHLTEYHRDLQIKGFELHAQSWSSAGLVIGCAAAPAAHAQDVSFLVKCRLESTTSKRRRDETRVRCADRA